MGKTDDGTTSEHSTPMEIVGFAEDDSEDDAERELKWESQRGKPMYDGGTDFPFGDADDDSSVAPPAPARGGGRSAASTRLGRNICAPSAPA